MKKLFALMVVFAALVATGCGEKEKMPPPANNAPPAEKPADETPAEAPAP